MKRTFILLSVLLVAAGAYVFVVRADTDVLAAEPSLTLYPSGVALVQVPYRRDAPQGTLSVRVQGQEAVSAVPIRPRRYWNGNYFFRPSQPLGDEVLIELAFDGAHDQTVSRRVRPSRSSDQGLKAELDGVTRPDESMRAGGPEPEMDAGLREVDVPDMTQRPAECAPTAAANSLISLAREHGADDKLPADPRTTIDELKGDMRWTPADGVVPDDFVRGKNEWAAKKGLPIRTELAGDAQGVGTLAVLRDALKAGKAAELRIRFAEPNGRGGNKVVGGHLLTVVGVTDTPNGTFIDVNDPRTPEGTETYRVEGNQVENYLLWPDGPVLVGIGFTQTWTGEELEPMTDREVEGLREFTGEQRTVKALRVGNRHIPLDQVHVVVAHEGTCEAPHWHATVPGSTRDTDGRLLPEVHQYCGYGKMAEVPVVDVELP